MAKKRKITYRLNRMYAWAQKNRMEPNRLPQQIITTRWLYNHGQRDEHTEKCIYHLYDEVTRLEGGHIHG